MLDPTITIGNIIEISTLIVGGIIAFLMLKSNVTSLNNQVAELKIDVRALNKIVVEMAVTDQRLLAVEEDMRELRHGRGFVREAIQGEWPR